MSSFFAIPIFLVIREPDVTLSDYALVVECLFLAWLLFRKPAHKIRSWTNFLFIWTALAAGLGGTVHGFFPEGTFSVNGNNQPEFVIKWYLWSATIFSIGGCAWALWLLAVEIGISPKYKKILAAWAYLQWLGYALFVWMGYHDYGMVIVNYLPSAIFLLVVVSIKWLTTHKKVWRGLLVGMLLTLVASALQALRIAIHPTYFNHNALYHLIMFIAIFGMFHTAYSFQETDLQK